MNRGAFVFAAVLLASLSGVRAGCGPRRPGKKDPLPKTGPIKLQMHGGEIRWRNVFIKQLAAKVS